MWSQRWNNKTSSWNVVHWELTGVLLQLFSPLLNEADELEKIGVEKAPTAEARRQLTFPALSVHHQQQMCRSRIVLCEGVKKKRRTRH